METPVTDDQLQRALNPLRLRVFVLERALAEIQEKLGIEGCPITFEEKN